MRYFYTQVWYFATKVQAISNLNLTVAVNPRVLNQSQPIQISSHVLCTPPKPAADGSAIIDRQSVLCGYDPGNLTGVVAAAISEVWMY